MFVQALPGVPAAFVEEQRERVRLCEPWFRAVKGSRGFRTLGLPLYQSEPGTLEYRDAIRRDSALLESVFSPLRQVVAAQLAAHLGEPLHTHTRAALPGFHQFLLGPGEAYPGGGPHFDLSHRQLPLLPDEVVAPGLALDSCMSFTLPLLLPSDGGGLQQWALGYAEHLRRPNERLAALVAGAPTVNTRYEVGRLYVYPGLLLHQIAPIPAADEPQERLTYQGHCVRIDGRWTMFW